MRNVYGMKDLQEKRKQTQEEKDLYEDLNEAGKTLRNSLTTGISFGVGALVSFYLLKHLFMSKAAWLK